MEQLSSTNKPDGERDPTFAETVEGLIAGDFSRLAPLLESPADDSPCQIIRWCEGGLFAGEPMALNEAFTCACFNGCTRVVEYLLTKGLHPDGGMNTGLNAFHWAANRGQLGVVQILIRSGASLETPNSYGGTVLSCTVWSAIHEPRSTHFQIVEILLQAGANVGAVQYPTGHDRIDVALQQYGARVQSRA